MRAHRSDQFEPSTEVLHLPYQLCETAVLTGLTAAQMRIVLVLVALSKRDGFVAKPRLEQLAGVRLSNAGRHLLEIEEKARIDHPGDFDNVRVFDTIDYKPGVKAKLAGTVMTRLSTDFGWMLVSPSASPDILISADELRQYTSVAAITLRLRIGAHFALHPFDRRLRIRLDERAIEPVFGRYGVGLATIKRTAKSGESKSYVSLARFAAEIVEPAAAEISAVPAADLCGTDGYRVAVTPMVAGDGPRSRWKSIDLDIVRIAPRKPKVAGEPSPLTKLAERERYRIARQIERGAGDR